MTKQELTLYLTYEFAMQFGLKSLKRIIQHKEVKIWVDEATGYPSFSYGNYHGQRTKDGEFLRFGCYEIHVRVEKALVEKLSLMEANPETQGFESDLVKEELLASVYRQIEIQVDDVFDAFNTNMMVQTIKEKKKEIQETQDFINKIKREVKINVVH